MTSGAPPRAIKPRTHWWLVWGPIVLAAWWLVGVTTGFNAPRGVMWVFVIVTVFNILRLWPGDDRATKQRLPWLFLLAAPCVVSLLLSPMVLPFDRGDAAQTQVRIMLQHVLLGAGLMLPLALIPFMRRAKVVALLIGILTALATLVLTSISILVLEPGS